MKVLPKLAILIKNLYKAVWCTKAVEWIAPTRVRNLEASTVCWRESARQVQLSGNQATVDCVQRIAVEDLVLSQEDKPKRHRSALEISHETAILYSEQRMTVSCEISWAEQFKYAQDNSPWPPAQIFHLISCSAVVWSHSHFSSHLLINSLTVCKKISLLFSSKW